MINLKRIAYRVTETYLIGGNKTHTHDEVRIANQLDGRRRGVDSVNPANQTSSSYHGHAGLESVAVSEVNGDHL